MKKFKIGFDIGGVISKFPEEMVALMRACRNSSEFEVYVISDMPRQTARQALITNNVEFEEEKLLTADWPTHGDLCKSVLMREYGIDIMIDDRPDYIAEGCKIGLCVVPRPQLPYDSPDWKKP